MPFFWNKNRSPESRNERPDPATAQRLGSQAVGPVVDKAPQETDTSYGKEVLKRVSKLKQAERALVNEAIQKGVAEQDLPAVIADAMNGQVHPKVVIGEDSRGSGVSLALLEGEVPPQALEVWITYGRDNEVRAMHIELSPDAEDLVGDTFGYQVTDRLPQLSRPGDPINTALLARIDTYFPQPPQPAV